MSHGFPLSQEKGKIFYFFDSMSLKLNPFISERLGSKGDKGTSDDKWKVGEDLKKY